MEEVTTRTIKDDELVVEMVASGICHTDILIGSIPGGAAPIAFYPRILGHEGVQKRHSPADDNLTLTTFSLRLWVRESSRLQSHRRQTRRPRPPLLRQLLLLRDL